MPSALRSGMQNPVSIAPMPVWAEVNILVNGIGGPASIGGWNNKGMDNVSRDAISPGDIVQFEIPSTSDFSSSANTLGYGGSRGGLLIQDTNPIASVSVGVISTGGSTPGDMIVGGQTIRKGLTLWDIAEGDYPLELLCGEGFVVTMRASADTFPPLSGNTNQAFNTIFDSVPVNLM
jgi:hypothetical protein